MPALQMANENREQLIRDALRVWAPNWPRRVTRQQEWAGNQGTALTQLLDAELEQQNSPFVSVYSFPNGHTKNGNIPRLDTIFIDFDFEDGDYVAGSGDREAWRRDISHLLVRARMVAEYLDEYGRDGWRAALSGHKGIHIYLDFPPMESPPGSFQEVVAGMNDYTTDLIDALQDETGINGLHKYVDVTSADLGRLCRVPNTKHGGATESFGEERYCVPVSLEELASLTVDDYIDLTSEPRELPQKERTPNIDVKETLEQYIRTADRASQTVRTSGSTVDKRRVEEYKAESNDAIELEDIEFLTSDRPCVWRWYNREDKYRHGNQSHKMELFCITELVHRNVPINVIQEFLDSAPEYDDEYSEWIIKQVISRDYNRFQVRSILEDAPEFCGYSDCSACQRVLETEDISYYD